MRNAALLLAVLAAVVLSSCHSPSGTAGEEVVVQAQLLNGQRIACDGKEVGVPSFVTLLKKRHVPLDATLRIAVPAGLPSSALTELSSRLISAGYRKILFTRPRQVKATVGPASPGPAASPATR